MAHDEHDGHNHGKPAGPTGAPQRPPEAVAVAKFLRHNSMLKQRKGLFNGKEVDFFRAKRGLRALNSPEYAKLSSDPKKNCPPIRSADVDPSKVGKDAKGPVMIADDLLSLLIRNGMIYRVRKIDSIEEIREKGLPNLRHKPNLEPTPKQPVAIKFLDMSLEKNKGIRISPQAEAMGVELCDENIYFMWNYEPMTLKSIIFSVLAIVGVFTVILFPLWPHFMRVGAYYLSWGFLGLIGLLIVLAIFRLILYLFILVITRRGFWLFPNLFADVGIIDSFKPLYGWEDEKPSGSASEAKPKTTAKTAAGKKAKNAPSGDSGDSAPTSTSTGTAQAEPAGQLNARKVTLEEVEE